MVKPTLELNLPSDGHFNRHDCDVPTCFGSVVYTSVQLEVPTYLLLVRVLLLLTSPPAAHLPKLALDRDALN